MLHLNTRSLLDKITALRDIATQTRAAISGVSETWLDGTVTNSEIELEGYNIIRRDRDRHGGGVCTFIRYDIAFSERTDLKLEAVWCDILLPKTKPIIVGTFLKVLDNIAPVKQIRLKQRTEPWLTAEILH